MSVWEQARKWSGKDKKKLHTPDFTDASVSAVFKAFNSSFSISEK